MTTQPVPQRIPMSAIRLDPTRVRSHDNPEKQLELAASMKARGQLNPIAVRQVGDHYEIIAGNRRFLAGQSLGWTELRAEVWPESTTPTETERLALVDNLQRDDFNPVDEAKALKALTLPPHNQTAQEIADAIGKSRSVVSNALLLLDLPPEVLEFVSRETLSPAHARFLSRIGDKREMMRLAKVASERGWSSRELERRVNAKLKKPASPAPLQAADVDPLSTLWSMVKPKVAAPGGVWDVAFRGGGTWTFTVTVPATSPASALGAWAASLGAALGSKEAKASDAAPKLNAAMQDLTAKVAKAPQDDLIDDAKTARLPETEADWSGFFDAVRAGPAAMYEWVYGAKSRLAASMKGLTWKDLGVDQPEKTSREILEAIKDMR